MRVRILTPLLLMLALTSIEAINVDSLRNRLKSSSMEEHSVIYEKLLEHYFYNNADTAIHYAYLLQGNAEVLKQDSLQVKAIMSLALIHFVKGEGDKCRSFFNQCDTLIRKEVSQAAKLNYNYYKAAYHLYQSELDSSLLYYERALMLAKELNEVKLTGRSLLNIGNVYWYNGHFTMALKYYEQSIEFLELAGDDRGLVYVLFNIANIYRNKEEINQAIQYYNEAFELAQQVQDRNMLGNIMNNKAMLYAFLNKNDSALVFINRAIDHFKKTNVSKNLIQAKCNKAKYLLRLDITDSVDYYLDVVDKKYNIRMFPHENANWLIVHSMYSSKKGNHQASIEYLKDALRITSEHKMHDLKLDVLNLLAEKKVLIKEWETAYDYTLQVNNLTDSLYSTKKSDEMAFLQKAFELMKHERETELLKAKSQLLELELENKKQSSFIIVLIATMMAVVAFVIFIIFLNNRQKKNELAAANSQLQQSNQDLIDANNVKNKLISVLSHDLKSPLSSIVSMSSLMEMSPTIKSKSDLQMVNAIAESSNMMLSFIDNTLMWFKKIHGNLTPDNQTLSLKHIMEETAYWFHSFTKLKNIILTFEGDDVILESDKNILLVLMRNLLSNAIKFSDNGQVVIVNWFHANNQLTIRVKDAGTGMSSAQVKAINEKGINQFAYGTNGEISSGLGLFLCKELLLIIGGQLFVCSEEGVGTEVSCILGIESKQDNLLT